MLTFKRDAWEPDTYSNRVFHIQKRWMWEVKRTPLEWRKDGDLEGWCAKDDQGRWYEYLPEEDGPEPEAAF